MLDLAVEATDDFASVALLSQRCSPDARRRSGCSPLLTVVSGSDDANGWGRCCTTSPTGACSVLEQDLRRVERPHGLPRALRQEGAAGRAGRIYRDVSYREALDVELDGRLFHDTAEGRDRDFDRDLLTLVSGHAPRLVVGEGIGRPCWTAARSPRLEERGWAGAPRRVGPSAACAVDRTHPVHAIDRTQTPAC